MKHKKHNNKFIELSSKLKMFNTVNLWKCHTILTIEKSTIHDPSSSYKYYYNCLYIGKYN